ncbi:MAG: TolC family protein [Flavobacteriales bacterium]
MKIIFLYTIGLFSIYNIYAQDVLTLEKAITTALEHNFDIQVSENNLDIAKNNKSIYNSGYLPTVSGNADVSFSSNDTDTKFEDGTVNSISGAESRGNTASLGVNYTIFNGFNRKHTFSKLKAQYNLSELQAREVLENTVISLSQAYYEVARLSENVNTQKEILEVSKERLKRANYSFEYGQITKLDVLNAQVDVNNDQVSYLDIKRQLANAKRDLFVILGQEVNTNLQVDTTISYAINLNKAELIEQANKNNVRLLQFEKNIALSQYDLKINKSNWLPTVGVNGTYDWSKSNNDATSPFSPVESTRSGFNARLNLSWNIFDGGRNKVNIQNTIYTLKVQQSNVETNEHNFTRTEEQYKLGQITTLDFRQAQVNLINAELSLSRAKYDLKNQELRLLQLAGRLL